MTTGRINQVAFLTDAGVARGRPALGDVTSRGDDGSRSMRAIDAEFGQTEVGDLLPSRCSASESSGCSPWAETHRLVATRNTALPSRFTPRRRDPNRRDDAGKTSNVGTSKFLLVGMQHRKPAGGQG